MDVDEAVNLAESVLPGAGPILQAEDPRWRALLAVRSHVAGDPEPVWDFLARWAAIGEATLRHALAVCLLQELLALHFMEYFPRVEARVREEHRFADTFRRCQKQGQSALPAQAEAFDELVRFASQFCGADSPATGYQLRAAPHAAE